jgi:hypothetical protein
MRVDDEVLAQHVGTDCVAVLRINPASRTVAGDQIGVNVYMGLSYPGVEGINRSLWEVSVPPSPTDLYCPLACSLSALDGRVKKRAFPMSFKNADDPSLALLKTVVAETLSNDVQKLSHLEEAVKLLLEDPDSPWFTPLARADFLPVALLVLGRDAEAAALVRDVRSTYGPSTPNQWRVIAYAKFADRVEQFISRGGITGSTDTAEISGKR